MIGAFILFSIAIALAVWSITMSITTKSVIWLLVLIFSWLCIIGGIVAIDLTPTNKDVKEGTAHYIEQNHIEVLNGDTINIYKTYEIIWNQNTK